jgi:predicted nucleic acid-binding protein
MRLFKRRTRRLPFRLRVDGVESLAERRYGRLAWELAQMGKPSGLKDGEVRATVTLRSGYFNPQAAKERLDREMDG